MKIREAEQAIMDRMNEAAEKEKPERHKLEIYTGEPGRDYRGGDFLNALDELVCWFENETELSSDHIAGLISAYWNKMDE